MNHVRSGIETKLRRLPANRLRMRLRLPAERADLLEGTPAAISERLGALGLTDERIAFFATALPEREAIWWGCMCVRHVAGDWSEADTRALVLTQDWVRQPEEAKRREVRLAAKAAGSISPPAFVARAVFAARLALPDSTRAGRLVENAVRRAAHLGEPARATARLARFLGSAEEIAGGGAGRLPPERAG